jgi:hypothetical protein
MIRTCPSCGRDRIVSTREFRVVFREAFHRESTARKIVESDAEYICSWCHHGFGRGAL